MVTMPPFELVPRFNTILVIFVKRLDAVSAPKPWIAGKYIHARAIKDGLQWILLVDFKNAVAGKNEVDHSVGVVFGAGYPRRCEKATSSRRPGPPARPGL